MTVTATKTLSAPARETIAALFAWASQNPGKISRRGNDRRTVAYIPADHAAYQRFAGELKPATGKVAGIMLVEWLQPHDDALSVSGVYLSATNDFAPAHKVLWVIAAQDGTPNIEYLTRDGGALATAMRQLW